MVNGRRLDRRDAEYFRLIEALARKCGGVELEYHGISDEPWVISVRSNDADPEVGTEALSSHVSLREALDDARKMAEAQGLLE